MKQSKSTLQKLKKDALIDKIIELQKLETISDKIPPRPFFNKRCNSDLGLKILPFTYNWNYKLNNLYFTTVRLTGNFNVGEKVLIRYKKKICYVALVKEKRCIMLDKFNESMAFLDTAYPLKEFHQIVKLMYRNVDLTKQPLYWYLIQRLPEPVPNTNKGVEVDYWNIDPNVIVF